MGRKQKKRNKSAQTAERQRNSVEEQQADTTGGATSTVLSEDRKSPSEESHQEDTEKERGENKDCAKSSTLLVTEEDTQLKEWPPLGHAAGTRKKRNSESEQPTYVQNMLLATGINISHTISSTNAQIGNYNAIVASKPVEHEHPLEKDANDDTRHIEAIGATLKSYAMSAENININYNISVDQTETKQLHTDDKHTDITSFLQKTRFFDDGHYILVVGGVKPVKYLSIIGLVPWTAVLDYDPESRLNGLFSYVEGTIEKKRSLHIKTWHDKCIFTDQSTCWIFMRGSTDRPETVLDNDFKDWKSKIHKDLDALISQLRMFKQGYTEFTIVALWHDDKEICRHFKFTMLQMEQSLKPSFLLVNDGYDKSTFPDFDNFDIIETVDLNIQGVLQAIQRKFKHDDNDEFLSFKLPTSDTTNEPNIDETSALYLNEDLEVLYLDNQTGINYDLKELQEEEENFFRGGTLPWAWWYNVGGGHADAERDIKDRIVKVIKEEHIDFCKSGCVTLYHAPGSGGTTIAQRILWDFRKEIPCVQVKHRCDQSLDGLAEKIQLLSDKTRLPILVLIDGEEEQKVEHIQRILNCCAIVLYVKRCTFEPNLKHDEFWLKPFVSKREGKSIGMKYIDQCSRLKKTAKQQTAVHGLIKHISQGSKHSIFEFGLAVHSYEYMGIYSYVKGFLRLEENTTRNLLKWQTALVLLSIAYYYGQTSVTCQFLSRLIHPQKDSRVLRFEDFPTEMKELVVRDPHAQRSKFVRISHYYVAKEIIDQILLWCQGKDVSKKATSELISSQAKPALEPFVIEFIDTAGKVYKNTASDTILKILIRTIISRDITSVGEKEAHASRTKRHRLSPILEDVSTHQPFTERINVVKKLTESFPKEPQFHAHLGRVYAICNPQEEDKAEQCFRAALDICEAETRGKAQDDIPQNMKLTLMYVYHMYGNMFSTRVSKFTGRHISDKPQIPTTESDFEKISRMLLDNTSRSCKFFTKCRGITPPGWEKSVGYIGEINVRLMFCDFISFHKCKEKSRSIHDLLQEDGSDICDFVSECFVKLDELFTDCFSTIGPEKMDTSVWSCQEWYVALFKTHIPGHMMHRNVESLDNSRRNIVILKMKYSNPKTLGVLDLVTSSDDIHAIVEEYENIFEGFHLNKQSYCITERDLDIDYKEWMIAIRHPQLRREHSIELVLTHVEKWFNSFHTQSARFYLFILKSLLGFGNDGIDGNTKLLDEAQALKEELLKCSRYSRMPIEWLGSCGSGIRRLYPRSRCFRQIEGRETMRSGFATDQKLQVMKGTICPTNNRPAVGYISLDLGRTNRVKVHIYYVPALSGMKGERNAGARVEFVIGFSVARGYEAFNVQKLGKAKCASCGKQNEFRSCDQAVKCTDCCSTVTRPATPKKRETFK